MTAVAWSILIWGVWTQVDAAGLDPPDVLPPAPAGSEVAHPVARRVRGNRTGPYQVGNPRRSPAGWFLECPRVSLDGKGHLVIKVFEEGGKYYDACVRTRGKFEHTFGFYVARIQFQRQPGHWSAFWLHTPSVTKVGNEGRDGTEIDIMEKPWLDDRVNHALHWDGYGPHHRSAVQVSTVPGIMEGFHTFSPWTGGLRSTFSTSTAKRCGGHAPGVCVRFPSTLSLAMK